MNYKNCNRSLSQQLFLLRNMSYLSFRTEMLWSNYLVVLIFKPITSKNHYLSYKIGKQNVSTQLYPQMIACLNMCYTSNV